MIPRHRPLIIERSGLIRHRNHLARMPAFLPTDAHRVPRDPQHGRRARDGRVVESVAFDDRVVDDFGEAARDEAAEGVVVGVDVRFQEYGDEVWFFVGRGWHVVAVGSVGFRPVGRSDFGLLGVVVGLDAVGVTIFQR